jgi:hypothetical protein
MDVKQLKVDAIDREFQYCVVTDLSACKHHYHKQQCLGPRIEHHLSRELLSLSPEQIWLNTRVSQ